jgi:hypothetical protein
MSTDTPTSPAPSLARSQRRRAVLASTVGTTIEWYDFFLYGTAAALVFPHIFFPGQTPYAGVIASFGTQFVGFAARPIGAAIFGHYGDRIGRKATLITTARTTRRSPWTGPARTTSPGCTRTRPSR